MMSSWGHGLLVKDPGWDRCDVIFSSTRSLDCVQLLFKYDLVKYDMARDEPVTGPSGFCQRVEKGEATTPEGVPLFWNESSWYWLPVLLPGETGLLLSKVSSLSPFFGYAGSKQLTERKLRRGVFVKGDAYFNTGDLMAEDHEGFISFRDRVGDTFRYPDSSGCIEDYASRVKAAFSLLTTRARLLWLYRRLCFTC